MRGSREISLVPSLHRASTDALIIIIIIYCFTTQEVKGVMGLMSDVGGLKAKASSHTKQTNKRTEQKQE